MQYTEGETSLVSDIAKFVLKRDVKLQPTNQTERHPSITAETTPIRKNARRRATFLGLESSSPERREDAVRPVVGGDVEPAEHLRRGDRLRVHAHLLVRSAAVGHRLHQQVNDARLAGARRTKHHHAVTHALRLEQLNTPPPSTSASSSSSFTTAV